MPDLGTAYVRVAPNMTGIQSKIAAGFKGSAGPATAALGDEVNNNSRPFQKAVGKLGGFAKGAGVAIGAGLAAGAVGLAAFTTKALVAGAELEQQLGGAEAVFGKYANSIKAAADDAYTNAGLSQAEFLQGANKMGALFQGSGLTMQQSMEKTTVAIQRASDVASIMGISTQEALEAVTGAAKGNFTMMDNLGVKMTETSLTAAALEMGMSKAYSQMSEGEKLLVAQKVFMEATAYAAGNYAKENETLAGSINTTKKAFQDFMATGNVTGFVNSLVKTTKIAVPQITALLPQLVDGIGQILQAVVPALSAALPKLVPALIKAATDLIMALVDALPAVMRVLLKAVPTLIKAFVQLFLALLEALPKIIDIITAALPQLITAIVKGLTNPRALTAIIMGSIQLFLALIKALPVIIVALVNALPVIIQNIVKTLTSTKFINTMIQATIQLFMALVRAIPQIIGPLVSALGRLVNTIRNTLSPGSLYRIGGDMVRGLWNGIRDLAGWIGGKLKGFGDGILSGIKDFFGIHSPSTVFAGIGRDLDRGLAKGITGNAGIVDNAIDRMSKGAMAEMTANPNMTATMRTSPVDATPSSSQSDVARGTTIHQNNNIYNQVDLNTVTRDLAWQVRR